MSSPQPGRVDEAQPLISWEVKASLTVAVVAVGALLLWWAALVLTASGTVTLRVTVRALTRGHPLAGLAPARAATEQSTLIVFGVLLAVSYVLLLVGMVFVGRWFRGRADRVGFASRGQILDGLGEARARLSAAQTRPGLSPAARKRTGGADRPSTGNSIEGGCRATPGRPCCGRLADRGRENGGGDDPGRPVRPGGAGRDLHPG